MKKIILLFLVLFMILGIYIYRKTNYMYITARFSELRPMEENIPVYYKGIVIGRAKERRHSSTSRHTLIGMILKPKNLMLPINTTVLLKKEKKNHKEKDFLELIYPKEPSNIMLSNGAVIDGEATVDINTFLSNMRTNNLAEIEENLASSAQNLNYSLESLGAVFVTLNDILKENQSNLYQTTNNFKKTTGKIERSIDEKKIRNTMSSIESTSLNIENLTKDLNTDTADTLENINGIAKNLNAITCSIRKTLRKKAGGVRLFFGRVNDECD